MSWQPMLLFRLNSSLMARATALTFLFLPFDPLVSFNWLVVLIYEKHSSMYNIGDHKPLSSVQVGDIGPKAYGGFASMDNGCKLKSIDQVDHLVRANFLTHPASSLRGFLPQFFCSRNTESQEKTC